MLAAFVWNVIDSCLSGAVVLLWLSAQHVPDGAWSCWSGLHNRQALKRSGTRLQGVPARRACGVRIFSVWSGQDCHKPTYFRFLPPCTAGTGSKYSYPISAKRFPKSALTWALVSRRKWFNTDKYVQWQFCSMKRVKAILTLLPTQHAALPERAEDVMAHPRRPVKD